MNAMSKCSSSLATCAFLALVCAPGVLQADSAKTALVIGNENYLDSPLINTLNDADDMAQVLRNLGFEVILRKDVSAKSLVAAVQDFGERLRSKGGLGLFYYSGHGYQQDGVNYLVPLGAAVKSAADVGFELCSAERVMAQMEEANNVANIIIFDACRVKPLGKSWRKSGPDGLAMMRAPTGSLIVYATAENTIASAGSITDRNSVFTKHLLKELRRNPDRDVLGLVRDVTAAVKRETNGEQVPWQYTSITEQCCLGSCDKPMASGGQAAPPGQGGASSFRIPLESPIPDQPAALVADLGDGRSYSGEWANGAPHGYGCLVEVGGGKYEGGFSGGLRDGYGVYSTSAGYSYSGQWRGGKWAGYGVCTKTVPDFGMTRHEGLWEGIERGYGVARPSTARGNRIFFPCNERQERDHRGGGGCIFYTDNINEKYSRAARESLSAAAAAEAARTRAREAASRAKPR